MLAPLPPRGIRNNNPGNIRKSGVRWQGAALAQPDPSFIVFETPVMGLRALMRLLLNYRRKYGLDTVESILNRFAPPFENATDHYIYSVTNLMNAGRREHLNLDSRATLVALSRAIVRHENGPPPDGKADWYAQEVYTAAVTLALDPDT